MDKIYIQFFKQFPFVNLEDLKLIYSLGRIKTVKAGERLLNTGDINNMGIFVLKGLLRSFILTANGEERTLLLSKQGMQAGSHATIFYGKPSIESIEAIESSILLLFDTKALESLSKNHPGIILLGNKILQKSLAEAIERIIFYTVYSPEERYISFRDKYPDLIQRVPQKYLASYLGVTTVSLSRIKSRTSKREK